mgnify:CR=1 FL=1|jgi:hypothetical protein|tara:strand:- start:15969 stop:16397 length:429 start_codon:yes stop_codon:yes gene_type:complete
MVSTATIRTNAWDEVYTYLQTTNAISTNNIFSAFNSTLANDKGYPLVIIRPPRVSFEKEFDIQGSSMKSSVQMEIEVFHTSSQNVKAVSDEVTDKLLAGRATFASANIFDLQVDTGEYDVYSEGRKKIHRISFEVRFNYFGN